jgi:hypothetical protein
MASSSVLPMVIASQVVKKGVLDMSNCFVNNSTQIKDVEFFKRNVAEHCKVDGLTFHYVGRQRVADWKMTPRSFVIAHNRFINVKAVLLDLVWSGIPVIHNSPWLRTIGCGLERFYYEDNDIDGACAAVGHMKEDYEGARGFFADGALEAVQRELLKKVYYDESVLYKWGEALGQIIATPVAAVEDMNDVKAKVSAQAPVRGQAQAQVQEPPASVEYMETGRIAPTEELPENKEITTTPLAGLSTQSNQTEINTSELGKKEEEELAQALAPEQPINAKFLPQGEARPNQKLNNKNTEELTISEPTLIGRSTVSKPITSVTVPEQGESEPETDKRSPFEIFIDLLKERDINFLNVFGSIFYLSKMYGRTGSANIIAEVNQNAG